MSKKLTKRAAARLSQSQPVQEPTLAGNIHADETPLPFINSAAFKRWLPSLSIIFLSLVFLWPTLKGVYIWDDQEWLTYNATIIEPGHFADIWLHPKASPQYYPLVFTTFWLEFRLFGGRTLVPPFNTMKGLGTIAPDGHLRGIGYHVDNLLLHIGSALLIYHILKKLKLPGGQLAAWLSAVVWAIHPISVESVAWVTERKNCLNGVLFFASLFYGFKFFRIFRPASDDAPGSAPTRTPWWWYALSLLFFILAMFAKTTAAVVGPVLLLMAWWRRGRISLREIACTVPFFVIAIALGIITARMELEHTGATGPQFEFSFLQRCLIAGTDLWFYIGKLLVPFPVVQIYPRFDIEAGKAVTNPLYYIAPIAFVVLLLAFFLLRKKIGRGPITALLYFTGTLLPILGFLNFYTMIYTFVADHYQYLACIGIIVLLVETLLWALAAISKRIPAEEDPEAPARFRRLTTSLVTGCIVLALGVLTNGVSRLYTDSVELWKFNSEHNPKSFAVWGGLSDAYRMRRTMKMSEEIENHKLAMEASRKSIEADPKEWRAYHVLGMMQLDLNQVDDAIKNLEIAEKYMPPFVRENRREMFAWHAAKSFERAKRLDRTKNPLGPHVLLAEHYQEAGDYAKALPEYEAHLAQYPNDYQSWINLGICYVVKDDYQRSYEAFKKATELSPRNPEGWFQMGMSLQQLNRSKEAADAIGNAQKLDPDFLSRYPELLKFEAQRLGQPPK